MKSQQILACLTNSKFKIFVFVLFFFTVQCSLLLRMKTSSLSTLFTDIVLTPTLNLIIICLVHLSTRDSINHKTILKKGGIHLGLILLWQEQCLSSFRQML